MKLHPAWFRLAMSSALIAAPAAKAGTDIWFTPLTQSAPVVSPNAMEELSSPWVTPADITQVNWVSLNEVENQVLSPGQSIVRVPGQSTSASMFDMLATNPEGTHLFIPHETPIGAGCTRYDIEARKAEVIFAGDQQGAVGNWARDFGAFDPCRWTPNRTLFLAEEWAGLGRVVEILNPMAPANEIQHRVLNSIPNVSHEGINFSVKYRNSIYFIDEWNSGSIYKFVMKRPGDYTVGQSFVLSVNNFLSSGGVAAANYNQQAPGVQREGPASWVPISTPEGRPLYGITDAFRDGPTNDPRTNTNTMGGRPAADDVGGTPYGRPEDMIVSRLANGNEVIYVAVTSENKVLAIEVLHPSGRMIVRTLVDNNTPKNLGRAPTTGVLNSPDNLAIDAAGNIYVIEDAPNGDASGGDIWFVRDTNNDGIAESLDHFMSIRVSGSEATGMIFNPAVPTEFHLCVQHPNSTNLNNVPNGLGDAVWTFDVSNVLNTNFVRALRRGAFRFISNQ